MTTFPRTGAVLAAAFVVLLAIPPAGRAARTEYPKAHRGPVVEDYFGTQVPDPFRWLESDVRQSDSVATWVGEQNKVTFDYLAGGSAILSGISASVPRGGIHFVTGKSGSGKSSLVKIMCGINYPTRGDVIIRGQSLRAPDFLAEPLLCLSSIYLISND